MMRKTTGSEEAESIPFSVQRYWDVNECAPPCCPRALLVETTSGELLHLESWTALPTSEPLRKDCVARRAAGSKTLLALETTGAVIDVEPQSIRESLLGFEAAECEWVALGDLPEECVRAIRG